MLCSTDAYISCRLLHYYFKYEYIDLLSPILTYLAYLDPNCDLCKLVRVHSGEAVYSHIGRKLACVTYPEIIMQMYTQHCECFMSYQ